MNVFLDEFKIFISTEKQSTVFYSPVLSFKYVVLVVMNILLKFSNIFT